MNLFDPPKIVRDVAIRFGENPLVLLSLFASEATLQNWTVEEIEYVIDKGKQGDYMYLIKTLKAHIDH